MSDGKREEMSELLGFDTGIVYERVMAGIKESVMRKYRRNRIIYNSSLQPIGDK